MSFVSKVLEHSGPRETRAVHEDMETLVQKLGQLQFEVHQLAENKFSQFHPSLSDSERLADRVGDVRKNITDLEERINGQIKGQLSLSTAEFQSLTKQLAESSAIGRALDFLLQIQNLYEVSTEALDAKRYSEALTALNKADQLFKQPIFEEVENVKIVVTMKEEVCVQRHMVLQNMADIWANHVKWNFPKDHTEDVSPLPVSLSISKEGSDDAVLKELVEGLHMTDLLNLRMKTFSERFQKFIVPLILEPRIVDVNMQSVHGVRTLSLSITTNSSTTSCNTKGKQGKHNLKVKLPNIPEDKFYITVFDRLINVLENLSDMILSIEYGKKDEAEGSVEGTLMGLVGRETSENLLDILQKDILAMAVPTRAKDLAGFEAVKTATHNLQEKLVSLGYICSGNQCLKDSIENVNTLFSNKKCALILIKARELMISDLLNQTVSISDNNPQGDFPMLSSRPSGKGNKQESIAEKQLSNDTFKMPECQISENVMLLMQLAYSTLHEATESSLECATQMYFAVHTIFELFCNVIPTHHRHNIENIPQMSAIHHNNCMYITHHLLTLGHQFALALPKSETVTFVSLIKPVRELGLLFLTQVTKQRDILLECLDEADGFANMEDDVNRVKCDRAIKQVLHQLNLLHKVWQPVLPIKVYQKAIGKLIGAVVERITDCITSMEDITQEVSLRLTVILGPLEEECAKMMGVSAEVLAGHIQNWMRLTNIKTVFNSNLLEIDQLWSEGKGPLALTFSPMEMKQMIRALFQNTDRRADVLSKIR